MQRLVLLAAILAAAVAPDDARAQAGDREGHEMPELWRHLDVPPAPVLPPEQAVETIKLPPGFSLELVAAEPLVNDPVAITWDARGRLWVVEMRGYMPNADGEGEDQPVGRIVVLEDSDADGRMDRSTVFLDQLVLPRAIAIVEESGDATAVLVGEPPNLWYCRDETGDLACDDKRIVHDAYGVRGPPQHMANGLLRGLDNRLYNAGAPLRFRLDDGQLVAEDDFSRGQWGIAHDDYGRLYTNWNSSYLHADFFPHDYLARNPHLAGHAGIYERLVDDQAVHPIRVNPGINRGYQQQMLRDDGRLALTTAISSLAVYRGGLYPAEFVGNVFVPEPAGNTVARFTIQQDGIELRATHKRTPDETWSEREFIASTDERFRPVNAYVGPSGALYIVDMYRGLIEHRAYVTTFLRKQVEERGLAEPVGLGRIYRVVHESAEPHRRPPNLADAPSRELVGHLSHPNGWWRDTAQRLLVQRRDDDAAEPLRALAVNGTDHRGRIHALWTLHGMGAIDQATVLAGLSDPHPKVRTAAMRTGEALLAGDSPGGTTFVSRLVNAAERERDPGARLQLMFTLGEAAGDERATPAMAALLRDHASDRYMRQAALSGLARREVRFLRGLLADDAWASGDGHEAVASDLAGVVFRRGEEAEVNDLLALAADADRPAWQRKALLDGMIESSHEPRPVAFAARPEALDRLAASEDAAIRDRAAALGPLIALADEAAPAGEQEPALLSDEARQRMELGRALYMGLCMACHQIHGEGQAGMAPSLVGTDWVNGDEQRLSRIVLHGLQGPIDVQGERWDLIMPGLGMTLGDEHVAAILTYIRQSWGNDAPPIDPEVVERVRAASEGRLEPWTVEELEALENDD